MSEPTSAQEAYAADMMLDAQIDAWYDAWHDAIHKPLNEPLGPEAPDPESPPGVSSSPDTFTVDIEEILHVEFDTPDPESPPTFTVEVDEILYVESDLGTTHPWYEDVGECVAFARWYWAGPQYAARSVVGEILDFFEKPWKWTPEYAGYKAENP